MAAEGQYCHLQAGATHRKLDDEVLDAEQRLVLGAEMCCTRTCHQATTVVGGVTDPDPLVPTGRPVAVTPAARLEASAAFPASVPTG